MGTMGALICRTNFGIEFSIGTGFTAKQRAEIWKNKSIVIGKLIKYKSFKIGVKDKPRHPVYLGERDTSDI
jgi:DNA ligase-1